MALGAIVVTAVLFVENTGGPLKTAPLPVPSVYRQVKNDANIKAIFEMPLTNSTQRWNLFLYCQTYHKKKMANGLLTRASRTARTLLDQIESPGALAPSGRIDRCPRCGAPYIHPPLPIPRSRPPP